MTLIDKGLYDRRIPEIRNIPEERAMRYSAACTSMLADRVEDLEAQREDVTMRTTNVEVVLDKTLERQEGLNAKVLSLPVSVWETD